MAKKFPEFTEDTTVEWRITFYNDIFKTTPVDPGTITFSVRKPDGTVDSATAVQNETGTGNYSARYLVDQYGEWGWRWETTAPSIASQGTIFVVKNNME